MVWWWPFGRSKQEPVKRWLSQYDRWMNDFQKMLADFPDHAVLEGQQIAEPEAVLLDEITDLYGEDLRLLTEKLVLKGELLRSRTQRRLGSGR